MLLLLVLWSLQGRLVCVVSNLKPAKLAGEPSQAMVLAASCSSAGADGTETEIVRPLVPPGESRCKEWLSLGLGIQLLTARGLTAQIQR